MPACPKCGGSAQKVHRKGYERPLFRAAYQCDRCNHRNRKFRLLHFPGLRFVFSIHTLCPRCNTPDVHRMTKRDPIDEFSKHPFCLIQRVFFAPRNKCPDCRLQYFDLRPLDRKRDGSLHS